MTQLLTDTIIERAKVIASVPLNQDRFSNAQLLLMLAEIVETDLFPKITGLNSGFNQLKVEVVADSDGYIDIPVRAYLRSIEYLRVKDSSYYMLEVTRTESDLSFNSYYFDGNRIKTNNPNETMEMVYTLAPPTLALSQSVPKVVSFNPTTRQVELDITSYDSSMDIVSYVDGYVKDIEVGRVSTSAPNVFIMDESDADPVAGDYLPISGTSCLIPLPRECSAILSRMLANRIMADLTDDPDSITVGLRVEKTMLNNLLDGMTPRGKRSKVIANKPLTLGRNRNRRWY